MSNNLFPEDVDFSSYDVEEESKYDETDKNSYLFDFTKGDFVKNPDGTLIKCTPKQAYLQWCQKVMLTPRFKKLAYPDYYGNELNNIIGSEMSKGAIELEIQRTVVETLNVHPKTLSVSDFIFVWNSENEELTYSFILTDTDNERFELEIKVKH